VLIVVIARFSRVEADSRCKTLARRSACLYTNEQLERSNRDIRRLPTAINHTGRGGRWLMFPSVRANFDSSPFIAHFHALSPRFSSSHRSSGSIAVPHRDHTPRNYRRTINLLYPSFRSLLLPFRFPTLAETPHIFG